MRHESGFTLISAEELAGIGNGHIAYMRRISGRELAKAFPDAMDVPDDVLVWVLFSADGTPIAVAGDAGGAWSTAFDNDLIPVAVH